MRDVAPDGSPVELYARLSSMGEPELLHEVIPPGTEILELGAGAGRMTHRFLELGHPVTAVDTRAAEPWRGFALRALARRRYPQDGGVSDPRERIVQ